MMLLKTMLQAKMQNSVLRVLCGCLMIGLISIIQDAPAAPDTARAGASAAISSVAQPANGADLNIRIIIPSARIPAAPSGTPHTVPAAAPPPLPATTAPAAPSSMRISQARAATPSIAAYLDIRSENGAAIADMHAEQMQAEIGVFPASVKSLQPFAATGEGVAYIFLVDVTQSLKPDQFAQIRNALLQWTTKMGGKDRAAIVTFGESVRTVQDFTADKAVLKARIDELMPTAPHTRLHEGLVRALDLGRRGDADLPRRRVIITLTDGLADAAGGSTREDIMARIKEEPVPIYAIGYAAVSVKPRDREEGFKVLGSFAHASGGAFIAADAMPLDKIFAKLHATIGEAYLLMLDCATCPGDGRAYPLRVKLQADNRVLTATADVRLAPGATAPVAPKTLPPKQSWSTLLWLAVGLGVVAALGFLLLRRNKNPVPEPRGIVPGPMFELNQKSALDVPIESAAANLPDARRGVPVRLTAVSGARHGREWLVEVCTETVIGRSSGCDVVIDDDSEVSSRNSILSAEDDLLFVEDLGSAKGTSINGSPITGRRRVVEGDLILVGRTELRLTYPRRAK